MGSKKMRVYQFRMWGKKFAVDIESGNFFEVDKAASEAIVLLLSHSQKETISALKTIYGERLAHKTVGNLLKLKKNGMLFSEISLKEGAIHRKITDLTLNIINACNLCCRYCWNKRGSYGKASFSSQRMSRRTAFKAIDLLIKESKGARDLVIDFYGGEPLLNFDLIKDVVIYCKKIQNKSNINFRFLLATNGTLLDREKGEFLIGNGVDIAVSLDGPRKIQDMQRPFPGRKGSFDKVIANLNSFKKEHRLKIVGRATFTPYSTKLIRTFNFLRGIGFNCIEVCESEKAGYGLKPNNRYFFSGPAGVRKLKSLYYGLAVFYTRELIKGKLSYENTYFNRFFKQLSRLYHIQSVAGTCSAGFSLMSVDIKGGIYPCTAFVGLSQFKIGDVDSGIKEKKLNDFSNIKISSSKECEKCWARLICRGCGSCYNLNYFTNKKLGQPDPYYCELFRYKTKLMIAMISQISEKKPRLLEEVFMPEYYAARGKVKKEVTSI